MVEPIDTQELVEQVKRLSENQAQLIQTISSLKGKEKDPFFSYTTPDPIRNIPNFSGNKKEVLAWVQDTEQTLQLFEQYKNDICYGQIVRSVKNKITGEAREILIASGKPTTWEEIKEALLTAYDDRRDITSYIQSLFYVKQRKKNLSEYYNKIRAIDTAIKSAAANMDDYKSSTKAINSFINLITLTRFIDGLNEEISMHVRSCRPETLEHAFEITQQYSNAAYRFRLDKKAHNPTPYSTQQNSGQNKYTKLNAGNSNPRQHDKTPSGKFKNRSQNDEDISMRTHVSKMHINNHGQKQIDTELDSDDELEQECHNKNTRDTTLDSEDDEYLISEEINFQLARERNQNKYTNKSNSSNLITFPADENATMDTTTMPAATTVTTEHTTKELTPHGPQSVVTRSNNANPLPPPVVTAITTNFASANTNFSTPIPAISNATSINSDSFLPPSTTANATITFTNSISTCNTDTPFGNAVTPVLNWAAPSVAVSKSYEYAADAPNIHTNFIPPQRIIASQSNNLINNAAHTTIPIGPTQFQIVDTSRKQVNCIVPPLTPIIKNTGLANTQSTTLLVASSAPQTLSSINNRNWYYLTKFLPKSQTRKQKVCHYCKKEGHFRRDCRKLCQDRQQKEKECDQRCQIFS
ncbi:uncharacterized protein LOC131428932 [Malaya genurostris]|uniref:uncharacterized protein LOC131428932 n=1 Tax=Malaya genurostris TaxID=325434 RepID=UPI0026F3BB91|nr:uncharacterized protein LOC131428932 [Malaya genurostris]